MGASKNDYKQSRHHSIASANVNQHTGYAGIAVQPPVVQLSVMEDEENQPQPEIKIQKAKDFTANPKGDDDRNTPPSNPNQGNGKGKSNLPFQLKSLNENQPIHSFLSGKSTDRNKNTMQQGPDEVHQFLNNSSSVLQRDDENESDEDNAIIRRGATSIVEQRNDYDISGTYREVSRALADRDEAGSITTNFSSIEHESINTNSLRISLEVTIVKSMPNWTNFQADYVEKANNEEQDYRHYYQRVVRVWNEFYAELNEHEEQHRRIDIALYGNAHTRLTGMTMSQANEELDAIEARATEAHDAFHEGEGGHLDDLPYIQQPGEERAP